MKVVMNREQYLDWKKGEKTILDIKLENLGIKDKKEFEDQLILSGGETLFLTSNAIYMLLDLGETNFLGTILTIVTLSDYINLVQQCTYWIQYLSAQKSLNQIAMIN